MLTKAPPSQAPPTLNSSGLPQGMGRAGTWTQLEAAKR